MRRGRGGAHRRVGYIAGGGEAGDQGRSRHRHRRPQRPLVQPARQRGPRAGEVRARSRGPGADLRVGRRLRPEPLDAGPAEVRPRDRRRLPDVRLDQHGRQAVPGHELRDHRLPAGRPEGQARQRARPALQGERGRLPRRLPRRAGHQGEGRRPGHLLGRRPEDPAGRRLHRRLPGRREGGRRPASRRSTATRRTSSTRRSARRSRSTRSRRARRSSSRSPASAASARSTRPRRRACSASASTPTRATWATTS